MDTDQIKYSSGKSVGIEQRKLENVCTNQRTRAYKYESGHRSENGVIQR